MIYYVHYGNVRGELDMAYIELYNEYISLLKDKAECQTKLDTLKGGYISTKTISGKQYAYLQYRVDGKLLSEYIRKERLSCVCAELDERARTLDRIREIDERLNKIEAAARILNDSLYRELIAHRRCAAMETMPLEEREKSLDFSSAMTALEGITVSDETEKNLSRWANGHISFHESFLSTLRTYHLVEG